MSKLILIRHSISTQDPNRPAHEWGLTEEGRLRCGPLAELLAPHFPDIFVTSMEPKARLTGELTAQIMNVPMTTAEGLHEHERKTVKFAASVDEFVAQVTNFFQHPDQLVFGEETLNDCFARYQNAVENVLTDYPEQNIALVSHGTVMALFIAHHNAMNPMDLWREFKMPAFVVLDLPTFKITDIVNDVTQGK